MRFTCSCCLREWTDVSGTVARPESTLTFADCPPCDKASKLSRPIIFDYSKPYDEVAVITTNEIIKSWEIAKGWRVPDEFKPKPKKKKVA